MCIWSQSSEGPCRKAPSAGGLTWNTGIFHHHVLYFWVALKVSNTVVSGCLSVGHSMGTTQSRHIFGIWITAGAQHSGTRSISKAAFDHSTHTTDSSSSCSVISPKHFGSRQELQEWELRGAAFVILLLAWEWLWFLPRLPGRLMGCDFKKYFFLDLFSIPSIISVRED